MIPPDPCPICGERRCQCGDPDAQHAHAMWYAATMRDGPREVEPRPRPAHHARHTTTAPVTCSLCAAPVLPHDGWRLTDTQEGLHYRCKPGATP